MKLEAEPRIEAGPNFMFSLKAILRTIAQNLNAVMDYAVKKTGDVMTGDLFIRKVDATLYLDNLGGELAAVEFRENGAIRWSLDSYNDDDFYLDRYVGGAYVNSPIHVVNADSAVGIDGPLSTSGAVTSGTGWRTRSGTAGAIGGNLFNLFWTGAATQLWIDNSNIGTINVTSDERVKKLIKALPADRAAYLQIRPISYRYRDIGVFEDLEGADGEYWGFSAQNLLTCIPKAVQGSPAAQLPDGTPQPMSVNDRPILAQTVLLVQQLITQTEAQAQAIADLRAELDILKGA